MANNAKDAWNEVGERFSVWGHQLAERYRGAGAPTGDDAKETQRKLEEAAKELTEQLNRAFTALGDTLRDAQGKEQLKGAVRSLGDAISTTVAETTDELRKRFGSS